ncbi:MAG: helix-turn-helix transcriptional regulator [Clostridiales bacterium]|nr:helix-turn-helix transcriptional regulator [Clostridiales bacterium]
MYPRIKELRKEMKLSQKEVSKVLRCSQQVYSNYELGQRDIPTIVLIQLAILFNTSIDYMLGISECRSPEE